MAKVKDQVLPGSDVSYIDSTGIVHYDADLVRHIMPNAYPLPTLNPTGVARETARNKRPSHQGPGTPAQAIQRRCFRSCVDTWYDLPRSCPEAPMCHGRPSIENVWQQKVDQGVMCSYYDLFMSCCMSKCQTDGTIGAGDLGCFDCPAIEEPPCSPGATSLTMGTDESQDIGCVGSDPCCDCTTCTMELTSGGGSLTNNEDGTWTYEAPEENIDCDNNPTFELCCGGYDCTTITLNISNNVFPLEYAFQRWVPTNCFEQQQPPYALLPYDITMANCRGDHIFHSSNYRVLYGTCADCIALETATWGGGPDTWIDIRSEEMKDATCCPPLED